MMASRVWPSATPASGQSTRPGRRVRDGGGCRPLARAILRSSAGPKRRFRSTRPAIPHIHAPRTCCTAPNPLIAHLQRSNVLRTSPLSMNAQSSRQLDDPTRSPKPVCLRGRCSEVSRRGTRRRHTSFAARPVNVAAAAKAAAAACLPRVFARAFNSEANTKCPSG